MILFISFILVLNNGEAQSSCNPGAAFPGREGLNPHLLNIYMCHPENRVSHPIWPGPAQSSVQNKSSVSVGCNGLKGSSHLISILVYPWRSTYIGLELCAACSESRNWLKFLAHLSKEEEVSQTSTDKSEILIHKRWIRFHHFIAEKPFNSLPFL